MSLEHQRVLSGFLYRLDLTADDERLNVLGKGGQRDTVLLDEAGLVGQLRSYLKWTSYHHGPLFRAKKNSQGSPLQSAAMADVELQAWQRKQHRFR